jgi:hypothetical protein
MRSNAARGNVWGNSRAAWLGAATLMLACGGRTDGEGGRAEAEAPLDSERGEVEPNGERPSPNEGAGGAGSSEPDNIGNIGGAQFMVATRCDGCGWRRSEARCLDLVSAMPFIEDPAYYPCLEVSMAFAACVEGDAGLCRNDGPAGCESERQTLDLCF